MLPLNERDRIDRYNAIIHHLSSSLRCDHNSLYALALQYFDAHKRAHNSSDYRTYRYFKFDTTGGFDNKLPTEFCLTYVCFTDAKRKSGYSPHKMGPVSADTIAFYLYVQLQVHGSILSKCRSL